MQSPFQKPSSALLCTNTDRGVEALIFSASIGLGRAKAEEEVKHVVGLEKEAKVVKQAKGGSLKSAGGKKASGGKKKKSEGSGADKAKRAARELLK